MQLYEQIEKDYWETFDINQGTDKINGYPVIKISDTYSRPATVEDFESFLKQSFIKYLEGEVDRLEELEVSCVDDRLLGRSNEYLEGYNTSTERWREQRDNQITHLQAQIKELEV